MVTPTTPPGEPGGYEAYGGYGTAAPPASSGKGTAALVLGILALLFAILFFPLGFILGVIAVILGVLGRKETAGRDGKATAGLVTGAIGLALAAALGIFVGAFLFKNADTIRDCSQEPTQAEVQACVEARLND